MYTSSWAWPNIFDTSRSCVNIYEDNKSIVSRSRLLILSQPTSLYYSPQFGVGLERHLWHYNTDNEQAMIKDRIVSALSKFEPDVDAAKTSVVPGLLFTDSTNTSQMNAASQYNQLSITVGLTTNYSEEITVELNK